MRPNFAARPVQETEITPAPNSYATFINNSIVLPSSTTNYVAVERHFFIHLMEQYVKQIDLDESWYLQSYEDVRDAIRLGDVKGAQNHYVRFGYFEHRMPYKIDIDEDWYLTSYPDIRAAIEDTAYSSGQAHFNEVGFAEGRLPYPDFALRRLGGAKAVR